MKPKDLRLPFCFEKRSVILHDRVLFVPEHIDECEIFTFPGWNSEMIFGNDQPLNIEYCSGHGHWICEKAKLHPKKNWIAVEKKFERVQKIWSKLKNAQLSNLFVISGEALQTTRLFFSENSIQEVYINFPDPWPKRKHSKHRLLKEDFLAELHRITCADASLTVVTDDPTYSSQIQHLFGSSELFTSLFSNGYATEYSNYGSSYFDQLWRQQGKEIRFHCYCKKILSI